MSTLNHTTMSTPTPVIKGDTEDNILNDDLIYDPLIISVNKFTKVDNTETVDTANNVEDTTVEETINKNADTTVEAPKSKGRKHMSDDMCLRFFADAEKLTLDELNIKYAGYCYCKNRTELLKKLNKQRSRLVKKGILTD